MIIATEDTVSEVVAAKLVSVFRPDLQIVARIGNRGKDYLKARVQELNRTARSVPVFLLVDLDTRRPCPADVLAGWLHGRYEANMLFRLAIMEVESWILADRDGFSGYLGVASHRIPTDTDSIDNPKEFVVNLARRSRSRHIRDDLVPAPGSIVKVGPAYNPRLSAFISTQVEPSDRVLVIRQS